MRMTVPLLAPAGRTADRARLELITPLDELVDALERLALDQQAARRTGRPTGPPDALKIRALR